MELFISNKTESGLHKAASILLAIILSSGLIAGIAYAFRDFQKELPATQSEFNQSEAIATHLADGKSMVVEYLRQNISELSPQKEVLGGKFYITSIEFISDNEAVIEYEDGHNPYKAQASFYIQPNGVRINSFVLVAGVK